MIKYNTNTYHKYNDDNNDDNNNDNNNNTSR